MDAKVIASIVTLIGILITAIFNSIAYWRKKKFDERASGRKLFYYSLELRHWLQSEFIKIGAHTKLFYDYYIASLQVKGYAVKDVDLEPFTEWANTTLSVIANQHPIEITEDLLKSYDTTLLEFATVSPFVAFQQEGYKGLKRTITFLNDYKSKCKSELLAQYEAQEVHHQLITLMENVFSKHEADILEDFDAGLLTLAKFCGFGMKRKLKKWLKRRNKLELTDELKAGIDELVKKVDEMMKSKVSNDTYI